MERTCDAKRCDHMSISVHLHTERPVAEAVHSENIFIFSISKKIDIQIKLLKNGDKCANNENNFS